MLAALERRHQLFSYRVDGWSAWRVVRNPVHQLASGLPLAQPALSTLKRGLQALRATLKLLWLLLAAPRRELIVKTYRSALRVPQGDQFRDVYFDGLIQRGHACLKLEAVNSFAFARQAAAAWRPADLDTVVFTFWGRVFGTLFPVKAVSFCDAAQQALANELQLPVSAHWLQARVSTVYWQARLYGALLARVMPKVVLVADAGEYALRIACHRRGVRFIELQHGVFDAAHPDAVPAWVEGSAAELVLPDVLACYGEFWVDQLVQTRQGGGHAIAVGNELIDLTRQRTSIRSVVGRCNLVLTSQGLDSQRLARWISAMVQAAPVGIDWHLSIKLHPAYDVETHDFDPLVATRRVHVINGAELPNVFDLLADADLHLSIASACHFDAAALGVPTVVIPLSGHEIMIGMVDEISVFVARSPADVWGFASRPPVSSAIAHRFATPGFVDNLHRLLL